MKKIQIAIILIFIPYFNYTLEKKDLSSKIHFSEILKYALQAKHAYYSIPEIKEIYSNKSNLQVGTTDKNTDIQYIIFEEIKENKSTQYISIRGILTLSNIASDFNFALTKDKKSSINIHKGFKIEAQALYKKISPYLKKENDIIITGHSMGGAISAVLGLYLMIDGYKVKSITTFGQPKVFDNLIFRKYSKLPLLRIIYENDLICQLPPVDTSGSFYYHFGDVIILKKGKKYQYFKIFDSLVLNLFFMAKEVYNLWGNINDAKIIEKIREHLIESYITNLTQKEDISIPKK